MNKQNKVRGFTIIELIVVIAIIAVLAAIIMVNVVQYVAKGKNVAIKSDMATMQLNAAVFFDQHSSTYVGFVSDPGYTTPQAGAKANGATTSPGIPGLNENESATAYCISTTLNNVGSDTNWCVDSTNYAGVPAATGTCAVGHIACQ